MKIKKHQISIVKKMLIAVVLGIICGILFLYLREYLLSVNKEKIWIIISKILFNDISQEKGFYSIGLFYIIGQLFMRSIQLMIVPLVLSSLTIALCSMTDTNRFGKIVGKTIIIFIIFYIVGALLASCFAYFLKNLGVFSVQLPEIYKKSIVTMETYNPLITIINIIPYNIIDSISSNNSILSVVLIAVIIGICLNKIGGESNYIKELFTAISNIVNIYINFIINKISPIAIFCMITRSFAIYGIEYLTPTIAWMISTIIISIVLVFTIYPIGIFISTGLNPFIFIKKITKVGLFAAATNSSAATLPLNTKTCIEELGCSEEISSFILPTGMTINMNGTTVMHMMSITFIATAAGINLKPEHLVIAAFLSICTAMGTPAIPVAGTTMIFVILSGLGFTSDFCMIGYALVLAMNYPPGMAAITLNVVGDAATNVIINEKENKLDKEKYYS
ncbi:dicarboxylate/amino acid:cation symporter [Brachyspira pilosicoli]